MNVTHCFQFSFVEQRLDWRLRWPRLRPPRRWGARGERLVEERSSAVGTPCVIAQVLLPHTLLVEDVVARARKSPWYLSVWRHVLTGYGLLIEILKADAAILTLAQLDFRTRGAWRVRAHAQLVHRRKSDKVHCVCVFV